MKKTSTLFIFLTLVLFTAILCAADVASIKIPSGTNLWATAASPGGLDKWSGSKKFTMELNRKENTLLLTSSQTGYSFGPHRSFVLKPATTYTYYAVARGKIAKGSKVIFLYMTDNRKGKTPLFARRADTRTEDFPWTLFTVKFTTPSAGSYPGGTASFRFALLYGSCQLEFASVGLVEEGKKKLPELSKKYKNILNNTVFAPGLNGYPADWNDGFEEDKDFFRFEKDKDGKISAALLPRKTPLALRQKDIRLNAGKRYRIGAWVKTRDLTAARSGIIVYNFLWQKEVGTGKLPVNTDGWEKIEAEVTLPGSRFELYTFAIYTVGNEKGAIQIKDPFLIPVDDEAARSAGATAPSRLYKITPVKPLLSKISGIKPEMTFSFRYLLPKKEDQYICVVRTKMEGMKDFSPPAKFPLKNFMIHAELGKLKTGKGILKAEILDKTDKKKIASAEFPIQVVMPVKMTCKAGKRLNMLVQRILAKDAENTATAFTNPKDGWVFIQLSKYGKNTAVYLDGVTEPLKMTQRNGSLETMRFLSAGDHTIKIEGNSGGKLLINSIPEIFIYPYPYALFKEQIEVYAKDFPEKYIFPSVNTVNHGYPIAMLPKGAYKNLLDHGRRWFYLSLHDRKSKVLPAPEEMAKRFLKKPREFYHGTAFDEIWIDNIEEKRVYTEALWKTLERELPLYTWSSGTKFIINGQNTDYLSAAINCSRGKGKFLFESYAKTAQSEKEAEQKLQELLNDSIKRANTLIPEAAAHSLIINGGYTNAGNYCTAAFPEVDVKKLWDMYMWKLANEQDFKDLYGVGLYAYNNGDEESIRWFLRLVRHYAIEGNKDSLAEKYGYKYIPGFVKDGDFVHGLKYYKAFPAENGSIRSRTIPNYGTGIQRRRIRTGNSVCVFRRSSKGPNKLVLEMTGFTPGKLYALRYAVADHTAVKNKKPTGEKFVLNAALTGAENVTAVSPAGKYVGKDGVSIVKHINNVVVVFRALQKDVKITFSDWKSEKEPSAAAGQELLLNFIKVAPYYAE